MAFENVQQFEERKFSGQTCEILKSHYLPFLMLRCCSEDWYNHFMSGIVCGGRGAAPEAARAVPGACFSL